MTKSSAPVTVTVWGTFQSAGVNVIVAGATVPSATLLLETANDTSADGWLVSTTSNTAVAPPSSVSRSADGVATTFATSLSVFVTSTSAGSKPS